jgi:hypothetical protein
MISAHPGLLPARRGFGRVEGLPGDLYRRVWVMQRAMFIDRGGVIVLRMIPG